MKKYTLIAACSLTLLTACGGSSVKETLGITRKSPDEFKVVSRPPLSMPPQFNLRPPSSTSAAGDAVSADKKAQSIIAGGDGENVDTAVMPVIVSDTKADKKKEKKSSESEFMKNIGADRADPSVRDELIEQRAAAAEQKEEQGWWSSLTSSKPKETLVNAKEEAERLKKNKSENKPVTEGETPEVKEKDRGLLGNIFGN